MKWDWTAERFENSLKVSLTNTGNLPQLLSISFVTSVTFCHSEGKDFQIFLDSSTPWANPGDTVDLRIELSSPLSEYPERAALKLILVSLDDSAPYGIVVPLVESESQ